MIDKKIFLAVVFLAHALFLTSSSIAEGWVAAGAAATEVTSSGKITAKVIDNTQTTSDALTQNCAGGTCVQTTGDASKVSISLAASKISGQVDATVTSNSKSSGETVTQNCAAAACAQVGQAGGKW